MSFGSFAPQRRKIVTYGKRPKTSALFAFGEEDGSPKKHLSTSVEVNKSQLRPVTVTPQRSLSQAAAQSRRSTPDLLTPPDDFSRKTPEPKSVGRLPKPSPKQTRTPPRHSNGNAGKDIYDVSSSEEEDLAPRKKVKALAVQATRPAATVLAKQTHKTTKTFVDAVPVRRSSPGKGKQDEVKRPKEAKTAVIRKASPKNNSKPTTKANTNDASIYDFPSTDEEVRVKESAACSQRSARSTASPSRQLQEEALSYAIRSASSTPQKATTIVQVVIPSVARQPSARVVEPARKPKPVAKTYERRKPLSPGKAAPSLAKGQSSPAALQVPLRTTQSKPRTQAQTNGPRILQTEPSLGSTERPSSRPSTPSDLFDNAPMKVESLGSITPRQRNLWTNLLSNDDNTATPSRRLEKLQLTETAVKRKSPPDDELQVAAETQRPGKRRLIDHLKNAKKTASIDEGTEMAEPPSSSPPPVEDITMSSQSQGLVEKHPARLRREPSSKASNIQNVGLKRTYAKQRSYLEESMVDSADVLGSFSAESPVSTRPVVSSWSQPELFSTNQKSPFDLEDDDEEDLGMGMKSIHELRAAGAARRLKDDVDALFEDLEQTGDVSLSSKRNAMLNLATRLADKEFAGKLLAHGLSHRLFTRVSNGYKNDAVLGFAFASAVGFILLVDKSPIVLSDIRASGTMMILAGLLEHDRDVIKIAKERKTNMSRVAQGSVAKLQELVRKSSLWIGAPPTEMSPQLIALRGLETTSRILRKSGEREEIMDSSSLHRVLSIASKRTMGSASGAVSPFDQRCVYFCLSIALDSMLGDAASSLWDKESQELLRDMLPSFLDVPPRFGEKIELVSTKLCLNVTNNDADRSQLFSTKDIVQALVRAIDSRFKAVTRPSESAEQAHTLDHLVLGLGAMINLAECSADARRAVTIDDDVLLNTLVRTYLDGQKKAGEAESMEETNINVAYGYLTVLLGNLCEDHTIRRKIRARLPHGNLSALKLSLVEFVNVQLIASQHFGKDGDGEEVWSNYTDRLRSVVDRLKRYEETDS